MHQCHVHGTQLFLFPGCSGVGRTQAGLIHQQLHGVKVVLRFCTDHSTAVRHENCIVFFHHVLCIGHILCYRDLAPDHLQPCRPPARERLFSAADKHLLPATEKPPHNDILSAKIPPEPLQRLPTYAPRQTLALSFAGKLHRCFFHISFPAAAHAPWPALCHVRRPARHDAP